ncbi:MAG: replicative DNA helicase [Pleurocapsa minor HA4230-MV1]|jgi:replicative DNA helicase|nr:replicative DNA helicase [Pleurocapsa minor HA4230-MV1]
MIDKVLPHNTEAESAIIAGIILEPKAIERVINILTPEAFYVTQHQILYEAVLALYEQGLPADSIQLEDWLLKHKKLNKAGVKAKITQLLEQTVSAVNLDQYAAIVMDKYYRRQLIAKGREITELGYEETSSLSDIYDQSEAKIYGLTADNNSKFQTLAVRDYLAEAFGEISHQQSSSYATGLSDLDSLTGGLNKTDLIIVAARASMGKTWLACYLANYVVTNYQLPVVFFSAEMSGKHLAKRFLALHTEIDSSRLIKNIIYESEYETLVEGITKLKEMPLEINDTPASSLTPSKIRSELRRVASKYDGKLGLVVLDYVQKLGNREASNRAQVIGAISGQLKDIAKEFSIPFVVLAQINRGTETRNDKRPVLADIKDSGDLEQDADLVMLLYRDAYYNSNSSEANVMEINLAKNRNGATGMCQVKFDSTVGSFRNLESQK